MGFCEHCGPVRKSYPKDGTSWCASCMEANGDPLPRSMPRQRPGRSKQNYGTPTEFIIAVKNRLKIREFTVDLAAEPTNAKAAFYYTEEDDSLTQDWSQWGPEQWLWLNPPFSHIEPWAKKCAEESQAGCNIALLVPASVGSNWWRTWVANYSYVNFLNGRLTFEGESTPYVKDCALCLYTPWGFTGTSIWHWKSDVEEGMVL